MKLSIFSLYFKGFIGCFLVLSFFIYPITVIFAQEVDQPSQDTNIITDSSSEDLNTGQPAVESTTLDSEVVSETPMVDEIQKDQKSKKGKDADSGLEMMSLTSYTQEYNPENLTAGLTGSKSGTLEPDKTSGAINYSFPIVVPPGRNGLQPEIKLEYNNQQLNNHPNLIGYGWNIAIPYIERMNKTGTDKLYTDGYLYSSLSGELVNVSSGVYAPKVENGNFLKYSIASNVWTVTDKNGTVYKFGTNAAERQDDPNDSSHVAKWMLQEVRETNDNYVKYEYYKNGGQIYPDTITYTGNGSTDGIFEVEFTREARSDVTKSYSTAFLVTTTYRIDEIITKVNGTWVKKYTPAYTTGDAGGRSLLASITESGQDDNSTVTTLPATSFEYYTSTPNWTSNITTWTSPIPFESGYQNMLDVNGDALPDIVESYKNDCNPSQGIFENTYINNADGTWSVDSGMEPPILFRECEVRGGSHGDQWDQGVRMGDVDGDLLPDIIKSEDNANSLGDYDAYLNTSGTSWTQDNGWDPTVTLNGDDNISSWGSHFIDLNGDGLTDIIKDLNGQEEQINIGTAFDSASTDWDPPVSLAGPKMQFVDVNNDNLPDIIYMSYNLQFAVWTRDVYLNEGDGNWTQDNSFLTPIDIVDSNTDTGIRFFDVNNDGLVDLVPSYNSLSGYSYHTYLNTGTGWVAASAWDVPDYQINFHTWAYANITDINADGALDFFTTVNSIPTITKAFVNNTTTPTDTLKKITFPQGGNTTITYKKSSKYVDGSGDLLNPDLPLALDTVYQIVTVDGNGVTSTDTFSYEGGLYYYNTPTDRKFAGFAKVTKTDSAGAKIINYYHQGNGTNTSQGEYSDDAAKIGKIYRTEITDGSGNIYQKVVNKWDEYNLGTGRDFVKLVRSTILTYDGDGDHKDSTTEYTYDNTYGNVTTKTMWGEVTGSDDGSYTDTGSDKAVETITYTANTSDWIVGLPYQDTVVDQSAVKVQETKTYYDTQSLGTVTDGNPTKVEKWKVSSTYVNTQKGYNTTYGLPTSSTDERGKVTTYTLDSDHLYPATITDALSNDTDYTYDYSSGLVKQVTEPNGFVYQKTYDGLDRVLTEKVPDFGSPYSAVTKTSYAYTDTSGAVALHKTDNLDGSNSINTYQYYDGLGRVIQDRTETESSYSAKDYVYNNLGLTYKESYPYISSGTSKTSPTGTSTLYTTYSYDPVQRVSSMVNAVGTTSYAYDDWKTTVTDPRSKVKNYYKDAYDNLIQVDEVNSGSTYTTNYEWNLNKNLTKITDSLSNLRNFTYDGLGRRLTAEDLHASGDGTFGSWSYTYDDAGNMTQSVSPEAKTVNYTYDDTNRVLTENETVGSGTEITYAYDSCTNGIGKLCTVTMTSGSNTAYTYDSNGNTASEAKTINSVAYTTSYTYDRLGNQLVITYPDSAQVKYTYNTAGQLEKIERKESGGAYTDVVSNIDYSPTNKPTFIKYPNGALTSNTYDATSLYRLSNKKTSTYVDPNPSNHIPTISLTGSTLINLNVGDTWTDPGYSASDTEDGTITGSVSVTGSVNTSVAGTYQLVYSVVDSVSAPAERKIRTVVIHGVTYSTNLVVKGLVVAGGGGGGSYGGNQKGNGGGGAGGYKYDAAFAISAQGYSITIGSGGSGGSASPGSNGNDSIFSTITAHGGGGGGGWTSLNGQTGGSGGGGGAASGSGGSGTGAEGYAGGSADANVSGGGGGGSSATGSNGSGAGGNGGAGTANSISGSSVTYAGGGGGGIKSSGGTAGSGAGGGGNGGVTGAGSNATANTGGGGGGSGNNAAGGNGGSGIVIISYKTDGSDGVSTSSTGGTITTSGAYTIHTFTSGGTFTAVAAPITPPSNANPVITLTGSNLINLNVGDTWTEPGYSATDAEDGTITGSVSVTGSVNMATGGTYQLVYSVVDSGGAPAARKIRTVVVHALNFDLQDQTYTYDANGNITQLVDASDTDSSKTVTYSYDDLNRMLSATATGVAAGQSTYTHTYVYNAIGNITSGPVGAYVYGGSGGSLYANPHAATSINSVTNTYDKDGNVLTDGTLTNTWNYKDQLANTTDGVFSIDYLYDQNGNRVSSDDGTTITVYPNKYYNDDGTKITKSIYSGDQLVATIETIGGTVTPYYDHTDHLGSIVVVSDSSGAQVELLDYMPYGSQRISSGSYSSQRQALGQMYDTDTALNYYQNRYMNSVQGRFISQDPVFWELGQSENGNKALLNPQTLNSYSYAVNNPITYSDPDGKFVPALIAAAGALAMYAPQITSFLQSLATPLGQVAVTQTVQDARNGNYGMAVIGALTAGELPAGKIAPVFDGLWTIGKADSPALNAISHATDHASDFGIQNSKDYVKSTRDFITKAINEGFPAKLQEGKSSNVLRTYDSSSNTFSSFEVNKSTNAITPRTMYKPTNGESYFNSQRGSSIDIKSLFSN